MADPQLLERLIEKLENPDTPDIVLAEIVETLATDDTIDRTLLSKPTLEGIARVVTLTTPVNASSRHTAMALGILFDACPNSKEARSIVWSWLSSDDPYLAQVSRNWLERDGADLPRNELMRLLDDPSPKLQALGVRLLRKQDERTKGEASSEQTPDQDLSRESAHTDVNASIDEVQAYIHRLLDKSDLEPPLSGFDRPALIVLSEDLDVFKEIVSRTNVDPELLRREAERLRRHTETYREHADTDESRDLVGLLDQFLRGVWIILGIEKLLS